MTTIDERDNVSNERTTATFEEVIAHGLDCDTLLLSLAVPLRKKIAQLGVFVGGTDARQAYKTLKAWPTRIPSSVPQEDFQCAIDEATAYLERWMCSASGVRGALLKLKQS